MRRRRALVCDRFALRGVLDLVPYPIGQTVVKGQPHDLTVTRAISSQRFTGGGLAIRFFMAKSHPI